MDWDVFICHASEDKESFARPLAKALEASGLKVWFDEFTLTVGDSLRRSIDHGLASAKYGIVILSPRFFSKEWPQKELDGLLSREYNGKKVILPIWHNITREDVGRYSPLLADRLATSSTHGLEEVVSELLNAMQREASPQHHILPSKTFHSTEYPWLASQVDDSFLKATQANIKKSIEAFSGLSIQQFTNRGERVHKQVMTAHQHISSLCKQFYSTSYGASDGWELEVREEPAPWPSNLPSNIIPVPSEQEDLKEILLWSALYSPLTVFVTNDVIIDSERIWHSGVARGTLKPLELEHVLMLNKMHEELVSQGGIIFLPRSYRHEVISNREIVFRENNAPMQQKSSELLFSPMNYGKGITIYKTIIVPHFRDVSTQKIAEIANKETDAFFRFNYYLKNRLGQLSASHSPQNMKQLLDEIDYEASKLNTEAQRVSRLKTLQTGRLVSVAIGLSIMIVPNPEWLKTVAGISVAMGVADLFKSYIQIMNAKAEMKKSDFFIPFLLHKNFKK
jgi:hypothetical protein